MNTATAQAEASGSESQPGFPGKSFGGSLHSPTKSQSILSCDYLGTRQADSLDNVVDGNVEQSIIKGLHLHSAAGKGLGEGLECERGLRSITAAILFRRRLGVCLGFSPELGSSLMTECNAFERQG